MVTCPLQGSDPLGKAQISIIAQSLHITQELPTAKVIKKKAMMRTEGKMDELRYDIVRDDIPQIPEFRPHNIFIVLIAANCICEDSVLINGKQHYCTVILRRYQSRQASAAVPLCVMLG